MALRIEHTCINCDMCEPECPNHAIFLGSEIFEIDPNRCTECVGHYDQPQCIPVCPIDCISKDPEHIEDETTLTKKFVQLMQAKVNVG